MNMSRIDKPHDKLVKKLLSSPASAKDILSLYLPEPVRSLIDLDHLVLQRDTFIDDERRAFAVDPLFKTTFQNQEGYLWLLLEHQRNAEAWSPVRVFIYMAIIWDHIRRTSKTIKIPLIYPVVLYNGDEPYSYSLNMRDLIELQEAQGLFDLLFKTPLCLIDLATIQDESLQKELKTHVTGISLLMTLKHVFEKNMKELFKVLRGPYKQLDHLGLKDELANMLYYLLMNQSVLMKSDFGL
jgi:predicted transposase/invertase (TIGR01784 family)